VASVDAPMKAWQEMIEEFQKAGLGSNAPEFWQMMFAPMKQRLDLHRSGPGRARDRRRTRPLGPL